MQKDKSKELSVIIPCKNEEDYIGLLLESLIKQSYQIDGLPIFIAHARSKDNTHDIISKYKNYSPLDISVIDGGLPSIGRNNGARFSDSKYILFVDADIELGDKNIICKAVNKMRTENLSCTTTNIRCKNGNLLDNLFYSFNNLGQRLSKYISPYATGMFMLFERKRFWELGGFDERVNYAEDFFLTKKLKKNEFSVTEGHVLATNRRFKKMGYLKVAKLHLNTIIHRNNEEYFYRDIGYWD